MEFADFDEKGFRILANAIDAQTVSFLTDELAKLNPSNSVSRKNETVYGVRNLLNLLPSIKEFSQNDPVKKITEDFLGKNAKIVRAIFFDKTAGANWKVPWHQDLTIAVREKRETKGFTA